jgi:hypothetical protein
MRACWISAIPARIGVCRGGRYVHPDGHVQQVSLVEPRTGLELCLVSHAPDAGAFDEFRAGLDHLEFLVADRGDLDAWAAPG